MKCGDASLTDEIEDATDKLDMLTLSIIGDKFLREKLMLLNESQQMNEDCYGNR